MQRATPDAALSMAKVEEQKKTNKKRCSNHYKRKLSTKHANEGSRGERETRREREGEGEGEGNRERQVLSNL